MGRRGRLSDRWRARALHAGLRKALPTACCSCSLRICWMRLRIARSPAAPPCRRKCDSVAEREPMGPLWLWPLRERRGWPSRQTEQEAARVGARLFDGGHGRRRQLCAQADAPTAARNGRSAVSAICTSLPAGRTMKTASKGASLIASCEFHRPVSPSGLAQIGYALHSAPLWSRASTTPPFRWTE